MKYFEKILNQIDISEILKNYPSGTKLYNVLYGDCYLDKIYDNGNISLSIPNGNVFSLTVNRKGHYVTKSEAIKSNPEYFGIAFQGECVLFPSKSNRNWKSLTWQDGDILMKGDETAIFSNFTNNGFDTFELRNIYNKKCDCYLWSIEDNNANDWDKIGKSEEAKRVKNQVKILDTVLVRNSKNSKWISSVLNRIDSGDEYKYVTGIGSFKYCIPYFGNEDLKGTTDGVEG